MNANISVASTLDSTTSIISDNLIHQLKDEARKIKVEEKIKLSSALNKIAVREGFSNWSRLMHAKTVADLPYWHQKVIFPVYGRSNNHEDKIDGLIMVDFDQLLINQINEMQENCIELNLNEVSQNVEYYRCYLIEDNNYNKNRENEKRIDAKSSITNYEKVSSVKLIVNQSSLNIEFKCVNNCDNYHDYIIMTAYNIELVKYNSPASKHPLDIEYIVKKFNKINEFIFYFRMYSIDDYVENKHFLMIDDSLTLADIKNDPRAKYLITNGCIFLKTYNKSNKNNEFYCYLKNYFYKNNLGASVIFESGSASHHLKIEDAIDEIWRITLSYSKSYQYFFYMIETGIHAELPISDQVMLEKWLKINTKPFNINKLNLKDNKVFKEIKYKYHLRMSAENICNKKISDYILKQPLNIQIELMTSNELSPNNLSSFVDNFYYKCVTDSIRDAELLDEKDDYWKNENFNKLKYRHPISIIPDELFLDKTK